MAERNPKPKAETSDEQGKKIDRVYFCPTKSSQTFYIPIRDVEGKVIQKTNALGQPIFSGNRPVPMEEILHFTPVPTRKGQEALCKFELKADDPKYDDKLKALESMRNDRVSWVMDKVMFEKWKNPDAAEYKLQNAQLIKENQEKDTIIEEMKKKLAAIQGNNEKVK